VGQEREEEEEKEELSGEAFQQNVLLSF
jgi:hypothetical protein